MFVKKEKLPKNKISIVYFVALKVTFCRIFKSCPIIFDPRSRMRTENSNPYRPTED